MNKKKIGDILEWVSLFIFLTYVYLKLIGVLKSPPSIDTVAIVSLAFFLGKQIQKLNHVTEELGGVKQDINTVKFDIHEVKVTLTHHVNNRSAHTKKE